MAVVEFINPATAARMMGVTVKYIYDLLQAGRIEGATQEKRNNKPRRWKIPKDEIEKMIKERKER